MRVPAIEHIDRQYRHIYLSPHYDDAILSCGGTIALQKLTSLRTLVVTIFGGSGNEPLTPFAAQIQRDTGLGATAKEAVTLRREEDAAATTRVGADHLWLDLPDAIYRGYNSQDALFGDVSRADLAIEEQVAAIVLEIHSRAPLAVIYAPLGIGHHVDHQIVCSAADRLVQQKANVKFYEDFPYVSSKGALEDRQRELGIKMEPEMVEISAQSSDKIKAISMYRSQVPQLFSNEDLMRKSVTTYASSLRQQYPGIMIERYWRW
jgi:LmbE family N-acetylglucosaminyl deacetylase